MVHIVELRFPPRSANPRAPALAVDQCPDSIAENVPRNLTFPIPSQKSEQFGTGVPDGESPDQRPRYSLEIDNICRVALSLDIDPHELDHENFRRGFVQSIIEQFYRHFCPGVGAFCGLICRGESR